MKKAGLEVRRLRLSMLGLCLLALNAMATEPEFVVVLHGLLRTSASTGKLAHALAASGYDVVNKDYPSTKYPIEKLAELAVREAVEQCPAGRRVHFVTHSLGGILVRHYLSQATLERLGRVVMWAPPNSGSALADRLGKLPGYNWLTGPAGQQLSRSEDSLPNQLGPADFELGVVAGDHSWLPLLSWLIPGANDGIVSVSTTKLAGMRDHIVIPAGHIFMASNDRAIRQTLHFLKHGFFDRGEP